MSNGTPEFRHGLQYRIEAAIEGWRDQDHPPLATPGIVHLYDPDEVKELARAIRDALIADLIADTANCENRRTESR